MLTGGLGIEGQESMFFLPEAIVVFELPRMGIAVLCSGPSLQPAAGGAGDVVQGL